MEVSNLFPPPAPLLMWRLKTDPVLEKESKNENKGATEERNNVIVCVCVYLRWEGGGHIHCGAIRWIISSKQGLALY